VRPPKRAAVTRETAQGLGTLQAARAV
jgi:hypothetical protein